MTEREKRETFNSKVRSEMLAGASYEQAFSAVATLNADLLKGTMPKTPEELRRERLLPSRGFANSNDVAYKVVNGVASFVNAVVDPVAARGKLTAEQVGAAKSFQAALSKTVRENPGLSYTECFNITCRDNPELYKKMGQPATVARGVQYVVPAVQRGGAGTQQNQKPK